MNATANNGRKALVYAIGPDGQSILVPDDYKMPAPAATRPPKWAAIRAETTAKKRAQAITPKVKPAPAKAKGGEASRASALRQK